MDIQHTISYRDAADELGKKLLKLYDVRMFPRQGKNFADQLFDSGIEAASYLSTIADVEDRHVKKETAVKAYDMLNRTAYLVKFMKDAKFYMPKDTFDIEEYLNSLIKAVREVIIVTCSQIKPAAAPQTVIQQKPAQPNTQIITAPAAPQPQSPQVIIMRDKARPAPQPIVQPIYQMAPQPAAKPVQPAPKPVQPAKPAKPKKQADDDFDDDPDGFNAPVDDE